MTEPLTGEALRRFRHDLRTPLNHIVGFADIMLDYAEEGGRTEQAALLTKIKASGFGILDSLLEAIPAEVQSVDRAQLEHAAAALRPPIAQVLEMCAAIRQSGACDGDEEASANLQTIESALARMGAILDLEIERLS